MNKQSCQLLKAFLGQNHVEMDPKWQALFGAFWIYFFNFLPWCSEFKAPNTPSVCTYVHLFMHANILMKVFMYINWPFLHLKITGRTCVFFFDKTVIVIDLYSKPVSCSASYFIYYLGLLHVSRRRVHGNDNGCKFINFDSIHLIFQ